MTTARRTAEHRRLEEARDGKKWRRWGTYLSERQWGTVREDYSANGDAWGYLPHDHARSRAYRWGEDGLLGACDNRGIVNFSVALWNGEDRILKERLFGVTGPEGNHGEDVKESYFYLDATPTHSYAKALYKYPHAPYPYERLVALARAAGRFAPEPELLDLGLFDGDRYFDVLVEYAKGDLEDLLARITVTNRGPEKKMLTVLPTLWFRNTWSQSKPTGPKPELYAHGWRHGAPLAAVRSASAHLGAYWFYVDAPDDLLFTENETNCALLFGSSNACPYVKDAFHRVVVDGERDAVNPALRGTKCAAVHRLELAPGETRVVRVRYSRGALASPFGDFDATFVQRIADADEFYDAVTPPTVTPDERLVFRQAMAGLLWSKQYYAFDVDRWLRGDPAYPSPPRERKGARNAEWGHLFNSEVLSMPDKWEYPWYAAWDLAFHSLPIALVDPELAKGQLSLLTREWYMHPNGQLPAYEWAFGDVNPPVHAWAAYRVYQIDRRVSGEPDRAFLESVFHKLMLNFTWWVNRKDAAGRNVFQGGFLGLDNIGVFDRSRAFPRGGVLEQADATSWMAMYCLDLLTIALELARDNPSYQDVANKFFEHFLYIAHAMHQETGDGGVALWDEEDGFYYDVMRLPTGESVRMKVRSMVGLIPLFAVSTLPAGLSERFPAFAKRMRWFIANRPELADHIASFDQTGVGERRLLAILEKERLVRVLSRVLDEDEFLSPYGVRALSRAHKDHPFVLHVDGEEYRVDYEPAESSSGMFGGNSNWRGPVWMPVNYLLIEALQKYHHYYGDSLRVECPTRSGNFMTLGQVADELSKRLVRLFVRNDDGRRPVLGANERLQNDPNFRDYVPFYEYFHGDNGAGLGASHQTGWTALVAKLLDQSRIWADRR
jgi:Glycosyl hydrolase family 63 C-terminal domain